MRIIFFTVLSDNQSDPSLEILEEKLQAALREKVELEAQIRSEKERYNLLVEDLRRKLAKIYGPRTEGLTSEQLGGLATAFIERTPESASKPDESTGANSPRNPAA